MPTQNAFEDAIYKPVPRKVKYVKNVGWVRFLYETYIRLLLGAFLCSLSMARLFGRV